jgi:hypothetical protein
MPALEVNRTSRLSLALMVLRPASRVAPLPLHATHPYAYFIRTLRGEQRTAVEQSLPQFQPCHAIIVGLGAVRPSLQRRNAERPDARGHAPRPLWPLRTANSLTAISAESCSSVREIGSGEAREAEAPRGSSKARKFFGV